MELYFPTNARVSNSSWNIKDNAGRFISPLTGSTRVVARPGDRWGVTLNLSNQSGDGTDASVRSFVSRMRGAVNSVWLKDYSYTQLGSFPSAELLTNNTFADGTTGWTVSNGVLTVNDRVARLTATTPAANVQLYRTASLTQYAPHVLRSMILDGRGSSGLVIGPAITDSVLLNTNYTALRGLREVMLVASSAGSGNQFPVVFSSISGFVAGDYIEVPWCSLSRCALVDNAPNAMTRSDELDHSDWTKTNATASANTGTAPDGTTTADSLIDDSSPSTGHFAGPATLPARASAAEDLVVYGDFKRGVGTRDIRLAVGADSTNFSHCIFDLGAGTAGSVTNSGTATNGRAFVRSLGNGWYRCYVVARAPASTTIFSRYNLVSGGSISYSGDGSSSVLTWRRGCARSSLPVNPSQTVATAAASGTSQSPAGPLHSKGWPASTNGLLLPGDQVQIGNQLHIVISPVNSDAAGLATIECYPARRSAPADNAPIIINQPMGKFMFAGETAGWSSRPGVFSDYDLEFVEDTR